MAISVPTSATILLGTAWTGTAPGGASAGSGTISSSSDVSAFCTSVDVPMSQAVQEAPTFGSGGFMVRYVGLKDGALTLSLLNDWASSQLDSIIRTTLGGLGSTVYYDVKPSSSSRSATNPSYVGAVLLVDYKPITVQVGNLAVVQVTWPTTGWFGTLTS